MAKVIVTPAGTLAFRNLSNAVGLEGAGPIPFVLAEDLAGTVTVNNAPYRDGDQDLVLGVTVGGGGAPGELLMQHRKALSDTLLADETAKDHVPALNWIGIVLRGGGGNNTAGIGTRIECTYTDPVRGQVIQTAFVDGGSLRGSQRSQIIRFGVATHAGTVEVDITWPDGNVQTETLTVNKVYAISDEGTAGAATTLSSVVQPQDDGSVNVVFQWDTPHASKRQISGVRVKSDEDYPCGFTQTDITGSRGDVQYTMTPVYSSQALTHYHHTLIWNRECIPGCGYLWKVITDTDYTDPILTPAAAGQWRTFKTTLCVQ